MSVIQQYELKIRRQKYQIPSVDWSKSPTYLVINYFIDASTRRGGGIEAEMRAFLKRGQEKLAAEASSPSGKEQGAITIVAASLEETKKLRVERADQIRALSATDFNANKDALMAELKTLRGVPSGWCNEAAGIFRTRNGNIYEQERGSSSKRRSVAWDYVITFIGAVAHAVVCALCFSEVFI